MDIWDRIVVAGVVFAMVFLPFVAPGLAAALVAGFYVLGFGALGLDSWRTSHGRRSFLFPGKEE